MMSRHDIFLKKTWCAKRECHNRRFGHNNWQETSIPFRNQPFCSSFCWCLWKLKQVSRINQKFWCFKFVEILPELYKPTILDVTLNYTQIARVEIGNILETPIRRILESLWIFDSQTSYFAINSADINALISQLEASVAKRFKELIYDWFEDLAYLVQRYFRE